MVATTSGETALKISEVLENRVAVICVAETPLIKEWGYDYPCLQPEKKQELEEQGVSVAEKVAYVFHNSILDYSKWKAPTPEEIMRETLYGFGQGLKVAVEVVLIAVASGFLEPYTDVIGVGGTSKGADTAIVLNATFPNHVFSKEEKKRLRIKELICKPL